MAVKYLDDGNDDGTNFGQSTTGKIGFYGLATPIVQPTGATNVSPTDASTTNVTPLAAAVNRLIAVLVSLGLMSDIN